VCGHRVEAQRGRGDLDAVDDLAAGAA
jgi:hypothetical protein